MKKLILSLLFLISANTFANFQEQKAVFLCSMVVNNYYEKVLRGTNKSDKYMHCAMSCVMAAKCGAEESMIAGVTKEIIDLFGYGNAELADLKADIQGVNKGAPLFYSSKNTQEKIKICEDYCSKIYR